MLVHNDGFAPAKARLKSYSGRPLFGTERRDRDDRCSHENLPPIIMRRTIVLADGIR